MIKTQPEPPAAEYCPGCKSYHGADDAQIEHMVTLHNLLLKHSTGDNATKYYDSVLTLAFLLAHFDVIFCNSCTSQAIEAEWPLPTLEIRRAA